LPALQVVTHALLEERLSNQLLSDKTGPLSVDSNPHAMHLLAWQAAQMCRKLACQPSALLARRVI